MRSAILLPGSKFALIGQKDVDIYLKKVLNTAADHYLQLTKFWLFIKWQFLESTYASAHQILSKSDVHEIFDFKNAA